MKYSIIFIVRFFFSMATFAQGGDVKNLKPLQVGDTVPDLEFNNMVNYPGGKGRLSDFKGKLTILDFWNLGCSACIQAFPKMQKLQNIFQGEVQILLVNSVNTTTQLNNYGFQSNSKSENIRNSKLPFVLNDTSVKIDDLRENRTYLKALFQHGPEPYHVWIDGNLRIVAMVNGYSTTERSIQQFIDGYMPDMIHRYTSKLWSVDDHSSLLKERNMSLLEPAMLYSSIITRNLGLENYDFDFYIKDSISHMPIGVRFRGSIANLFRQALQTTSPLLLDVATEIRFGLPYGIPSTDEWRKSNFYYYEAKFSETPSPINCELYLKTVMLQDLERFFHAKASVENKMIPALILTRKRGDIDFRTKGGLSIWERNGDGDYLIQNANFGALLGSILFYANKEKVSVIPVLNETGINDTLKVDMQLQGDLSDLRKLQIQLNRYGLEIKKELRMTKVLFINDLKDK